VFSDAVRTTNRILERRELATWREQEHQAGVRSALAAIGDLDFERLRTTCSEKNLKTIEDHIKIVVDRITAETAGAPPDVQVLSGDKQKVDAATALLKSRELETEIHAVEKVVRFVEALEKQVREEIKARSCAVIKDISADVQRMWAILHPGERVEHVRLHMPDDTDKAIDIALRFCHGWADFPG
jgi:sugar-specific transcriptional regulator TrmB